MSLPQLDTASYASQAFWLYLSILVVFLVIRIILVPHMENIFLKPIVESEKMLKNVEFIDEKLILMRDEYDKACLLVRQDVENLKKDSLIRLKEDLYHKIQILNASHTSLSVEKNFEYIDIKTSDTLQLHTLYKNFLKNPTGCSL
jgi:hypothetical protein